MPRDVFTGIALTSMAFAVSAHLPMIGFFCALLIPIPVLFYRVKLGRSGGAAVVLGTLLVMGGIAGHLSVDVGVFTGLLLLGLVLAELFEHRLSIEKTVGYACGFVLAAAAASLLLLGGISVAGTAQMVSVYVTQNLEVTLAVYRRLGVSEENIGAIAESMDQIAHVLVRILPAFAAVFCLLAAWTSLLIARPLFANRGLTFPDFGRLNHWKAPDLLVWGVIACGLMLLVESGGLRMIGLNGLMVLMTVYFFQGIAILSFFFEKKGFSRALRCFLYSLIVLQQLLLLLVIGCGFFDTWINFRRLGLTRGA